MKSRAELESRITELEEALRAIIQQRHDWAQGLGDGSALGDVIDAAESALSAAPQASTEQVCDCVVTCEGACQGAPVPQATQVSAREWLAMPAAPLTAERLKAQLVAALRSVCHGYDPTEGMFREVAHRLEQLP